MKIFFSVIFQVLLFTVALTFPLFNFNFEVAIILTSISLLFTILIGFFIAAATSNYLKLQTLIAREDSCIISIYKIVKIAAPKSAAVLSSILDNYMIAILDYSTLEYARYTKEEFNKMIEAIDKIILENQNNSSLIPELQKKKDELIAIKLESSLSNQKIVSKRHWFILVVLASLISILLLSIRNGGLFTSILIGLIIITMYQTLRLLYDIDSNDFLAKKFAYQLPQSVFQAIEKPKYFPEIAFKFYPKLKKSLKDETYRVGRYKNLHKNFDKNVEIIK